MPRYPGGLRKDGEIKANLSNIMRTPPLKGKMTNITASFKRLTLSTAKYALERNF